MNGIQEVTGSTPVSSTNYLPIIQYLLDETGAEKVEIRLEFKPGETDQTRKDAVIKELIAEIRNRTAVTMAVVEVPHGTVERFEWKPKRWKDQRMEGLDQVSV